LKQSREVKATMLRHQVVHTNEIIPNNKLDIITRDNEEGICMLTDLAISGDKIVIKKDSKI
jgi:hypothetical protein